MIALLSKALLVVLGLLVIAGVSIWMLGTRQPSQVISRYDSVIFLALKHANPAHVRTTGLAGVSPLWRGSVAFPFIGIDENYWTDYLILPPDSALPDEVKDSTGFEDVFAAEVELVKVPAFVVGALRAMHKLGLMKRPDGPLPESIDEVEGRLDILPPVDAMNASRAAAPGMQVTMVNYLEYKPMEGGGKKKGRRTYNKYGAEAMKAVHMVGGQFLFAGRISKVLIEPKNTMTPGEWDDLAAMIYPDPMAIFYMEQNAGYKGALDFRDNSLERTVVIATEAY